MTAQYQLVVQSGPNPGKIFPLEGDVITIGREADNAIVINDAEVSRKHTQLMFQGGKYVVTDLGSTNGTFLNGQRLTGQHVLQPGETISLGEHISLMYESMVQIDPNATMLSNNIPSAARQTAVPVQPVRPAVPAESQSSYAGNVPSGPSYSTPAPAKTGNNKMLVIILAVIVLCIICSCVGILYYIDANNLWCNYLGFLFGGSCGG